MNFNATRTIRIAAALLTDDRNRLILVRKRGTDVFMQPGGKIEPHETAREALVRELREELGLLVEPSSATYLGQFVAPAAHEQGFTVQAELFNLSTAKAFSPAAEIAELILIDPTSPHWPDLAPLTRDHVLPLYRSLIGP